MEDHAMAITTPGQPGTEITSISESRKRVVEYITNALRQQNEVTFDALHRYVMDNQLYFGTGVHSIDVVEMENVAHVDYGSGVIRRGDDKAQRP